jgi:hypothetical protein
MFREPLLTSKKVHRILFAFSLSAVGALALTGCETFGPSKISADNPYADKIQSREFIASFDAVWRAAQISIRYPIKLNNMETGQLVTEKVQALDGFIPPDQEQAPSAGIRYNLTLNIVRGRKKNRETVRVTIRKLVERTKDFFAEPESISSDGYEEKVILYRIEREILIQEALKKIPEPKG